MVHILFTAAILMSLAMTFNVMAAPIKPRSSSSSDAMVIPFVPVQLLDPLAASLQAYPMDSSSPLVCPSNPGEVRYLIGMSKPTRCMVHSLQSRAVLAFTTAPASGVEHFLEKNWQGLPEVVRLAIIVGAQGTAAASNGAASSSSPSSSGVAGSDLLLREQQTTFYLNVSNVGLTVINVVIAQVDNSTVAFGYTAVDVSGQPVNIRLEVQAYSCERCNPFHKCCKEQILRPYEYSLADIAGIQWALEVVAANRVRESVPALSDLAASGSSVPVAAAAAAATKLMMKGTQGSAASADFTSGARGGIWEVLQQELDELQRQQAQQSSGPGSAQPLVPEVQQTCTATTVARLPGRHLSPLLARLGWPLLESQIIASSVLNDSVSAGRRPLPIAAISIHSLKAEFANNTSAQEDTSTGSKVVQSLLRVTLNASVVVVNPAESLLPTMVQVGFINRLFLDLHTANAQANASSSNSSTDSTSTSTTKVNIANLICTDFSLCAASMTKQQVVAFVQALGALEDCLALQGLMRSDDKSATPVLLRNNGLNSRSSKAMSLSLSDLAELAFNQSKADCVAGFLPDLQTCAANLLKATAVDNELATATCSWILEQYSPALLECWDSGQPVPADISLALAEEAVQLPAKTNSTSSASASASASNSNSASATGKKSKLAAAAGFGPVEISAMFEAAQQQLAFVKSAFSKEDRDTLVRVEDKLKFRQFATNVHATRISSVLPRMANKVALQLLSRLDLPADKMKALNDEADILNFDLEEDDDATAGSSSSSSSPASVISTYFAEFNFRDSHGNWVSATILTTDVDPITGRLGVLVAYSKAEFLVADDLFIHEHFHSKMGGMSKSTDTRIEVRPHSLTFEEVQAIQHYLALLAAEAELRVLPSQPPKRPNFRSNIATPSEGEDDDNFVDAIDIDVDSTSSSSSSNSDTETVPSNNDVIDGNRDGANSSSNSSSRSTSDNNSSSSSSGIGSSSSVGSGGSGSSSSSSSSSSSHSSRTSNGWVVGVGVVGGCLGLVALVKLALMTRSKINRMGYGSI